ncbi:MAG: YvcK family protein [Anaerolineae bacterium]|nr:YvcK family protein [Anaerolineae bacterium]MDW8102399.1 YvcK family protein [Anaerolineae bacterium]
MPFHINSIAGIGCGFLPFLIVFLRKLGRRPSPSGPRVVAIGGGHGLYTLLRGLKKYTPNITAVITVADDGGSSGRIRRDFNTLPPGDFRNCLVALADDEDLMAKLFQYRFGRGAGLDGHTLGNLFITALTELTGSFEKALSRSAQVLAIHGRILPSTTERITLCAEIHCPETLEVVLVEGESAIPRKMGKIERVFIKPEGARAYPETLKAILGADIITLGPGSLFTSIMPNLLVEEIAWAIRASKAMKIYICNIATQKGETDGFTLEDHVKALEKIAGKGLFDIIIANNNLDFEVPGGEPVRPTMTELSYRVVVADLVDRENPWRHDPVRLAEVIMTIYHQGGLK